MNECLLTATSTTKLTLFHSILFARLHSFCSAQVKTKYTTSINKTYNNNNFKTAFDFNVPDYLWKKFIPHAIYDMFNELHNNPISGSGYILQGATSDDNTFISKWAGSCSTSSGCLSSLANFDRPGVAAELDPKMCPSYSDYVQQRCKLGASDVIYFDKAKDLFDVSEVGGERAEAGGGGVRKTRIRASELTPSHLLRSA